MIFKSRNRTTNLYNNNTVQKQAYGIKLTINEIKLIFHITINIFTLQDHFQLFQFLLLI